MSFTNRTAQAFLNSLFGKTSNFGALASAPSIYVALSRADPGEDGSGLNEPSGDGYARVSTAASDWNTATLADPSVMDNANTITFPQATASWGVITHFALCDASGSGNVLLSGALDVSKTPTNGDVPKFDPGELNVTLD